IFDICGRTSHRPCIKLSATSEYPGQPLGEPSKKFRKERQKFAGLRTIRKFTKQSYINMQKLTQQEEEAMQLIWQNKGGFVKDILELLPEPKVPYTTLASTLKNLERKQY